MDFSLFLRSSSAAPGHSAGHYMFQQGATLLSQGQTSNGKRIKRMTQMNEWRKKHKVRRLKSSIQHTLKFHNSMFNSPLLSIKQRPTQVHLLGVHLEHSNKSSCKYPQTPLQSVKALLYQSQLGPHLCPGHLRWKAVVEEVPMVIWVCFYINSLCS